MPDLKTGQIHWDAKHDKLGPYNAEAFVDVHAQVSAASLSSPPVSSPSNRWPDSSGTLSYPHASPDDALVAHDYRNSCRHVRYVSPAQVGGVTTQGVAVRGSTKKGKAGW